MGGLAPTSMDGRANTFGETPFYLLHTPTPSNDHWSNRVRLPSEAGRAEGRTFAATSEPWERVLLSLTNEPLRTAWWEWKSPTSGRWAVPVVRDSGWNALVVFRGVEPLASNQVSPGPEPVLCFDAQAGEVFQIAAYDRVPDSFGSSLIFGIRPVALPELRLITVPLTQWEEPALELQIGDGPGLPYVIEVSSDLINWQPHWYLFEAHGFSTQAQIVTTQRFYRTRWIATP